MDWSAGYRSKQNLKCLGLKKFHKGLNSGAAEAVLGYYESSNFTERCVN